MKFSRWLLLVTIFAFVAGCVGPNASRNALSGVEASKATVKAALGAWNEWLGVQYKICDALPAERKQARAKELLDDEMAVKAALGKYNLALLSVDKAWDAYDQAVSLTPPGGSPPDISLVKSRIAAVEVAANAVFDVVKAWIPELKKAR